MKRKNYIYFWFYYAGTNIEKTKQLFMGKDPLHKKKAKLSMST